MADKLGDRLGETARSQLGFLLSPSLSEYQLRVAREAGKDESIYP